MKKNIVFVFLLFCLSHLGFGQTETNFALTPQVIPQYPDRFYDYFDNQKLILLVQSAAANFSYKDIRLIGKFSGDNGIVVQTSEVYIPFNRIHCEQGQTVIVNAYELRHYFEMNNIFTENISKNDLLNKPLPEGSYQFCFVAYADTMGSTYQVSPSEPVGCSNPFQISNLSAVEPPTLIAPICDSKVSPLLPQNLIFSWLPVSGITLPEYTFKLIELAPGQDPNIAIDAQSGNLFFETTSLTSSLIYGPANPPLEIGKKYVWRVTVRDLNKNNVVNNNGRSEVCIFEYIQENIQSTNNFHLISPLNGTTLVETPKGFEFKYSQTAAGNYAIYFAEIPKGLSAEKAMANAIKDKTYFIETGKELPSEYTTFFVGNYDQKFKSGKSYAWCVKSETDFTAETWSFSMPASENDSLTINNFLINGFKVKVTSIENSNPKFFCGKGKIDLFNDPFGPQVNVSFYGLSLVNLSYDNTKGKGDWECINGSVDGDVQNFKPIKLQDKYNAGGNFFLAKGSKVALKASKEASYSDSKKTYTITKTSTENKSQLLTQLIWETEVVPQEGGYNVGDVNSNTFSSGALLISSSEMFINFSSDKLFQGTMQSSKQIQFKTQYPKDFEIEILNPQFEISGTDVKPYLNGSLNVPDGRSDLDKDLKFQFTAQKGFHFTTDIPKYSIELNSGSAAKIKSTLSFEKVEVDLKVGGGINLPEAKVTSKFPNQDIVSAYMTGYNHGNGYYIKEKQSVNTKTTLNSFNANLTESEIYVIQSKLYQFKLKGNLQVPFINQDATIEYVVNEDGDGNGTLYFTNVPSTIYDDAITNDKLAVIPSSGQLLDDRIVTNLDFTFSNKKNENLNVSHLEARDLYIKADGEIGWYQSGFQWTNYWNINQSMKWRALTQQQTGNFSGFTYKVNRLGINYTSPKQYKFALSGDIVLEEHSLATSKFEVQMAFIQESALKFSIEKEPIASTNLLLPSSSTSLMLPASAVELKPNGVKTEYHDGSLDFVTEVQYFKGDAIFGNGFKSESNAVMKTPIEKSVYSKIQIGKSNGFNYWYVQGKYSDDAGIPTGILDLSIFDFDGRFYYNMDHSIDVQKLSDNTYTPDNNIGLGLFALTHLKSAASNGAIIDMQGAMKAETGNPAINLYCKARMLNEDLVSGKSMIDGDAVVTWNISPLYIDGNIRLKNDLFGVFGGADINGHLFLDPSTLSLQISAPMHIKYIDIDAAVTAGILMNTDLKCNVSAGFSGEIAGITKDVGVCNASASLNVNAAMAGEFKYGIPFNLGGTGGLKAKVSCGAFGGGVAVKGSYNLPTPFCLAASLSFSVPYPSGCCACSYVCCPYPCIDYYDKGFGVRWKSNADPIFSFSSTCQ